MLTYALETGCALRAVYQAQGGCALVLTLLLTQLWACEPSPLPLDPGGGGSSEAGRDALGGERGPEAGLAAGLEAGEGAGGAASIGVRGDELVGLWRATQTTTTVMTLPVVMEELKTTLTASLSLVIRQEGGALWLNVKTCAVESLSVPDIGQRLIPEPFIDSLSPLERGGRLWREGPELKLSLEPAYEVRGARLDDPINDPLPTSADDPRVIDADRDGQPGLTVTLTGFPAGEVYLVQRTWDAWSATFSAAEGEPVDQVSGVVEWGEEQVRLGATNEALLLDVPQQIPRGEGLQTFEMWRVEPDEAPCD